MSLMLPEGGPPYSADVVVTQHGPHVSDRDTYTENVSNFNRVLLVVLGEEHALLFYHYC